ncbi:MAG: TetR family transcriptional regulator [Patescibacteria group bacterium]|nr:TetR family transcriptional regulator [Patescibacteria group bacterium]
MTKIQYTDFLEEAVTITAHHGIEGLSIRSLARALSIPPSLVCYHFHSKKELEASMASYAIDVLATERKHLCVHASLEENIKDRIAFQFKHARYVVAILKYYMGNREDFQKHDHGYLPETAYQHIKEILPERYEHRDQRAKILTHAINGYVLEYFPETMDEREIRALVCTLKDLLL